jgi:hypothetical protein
MAFRSSREAVASAVPLPSDEPRSLTPGDIVMMMDPDSEKLVEARVESVTETQDGTLIGVVYENRLGTLHTQVALGDIEILDSPSNA